MITKIKFVIEITVTYLWMISLETKKFCLSALGSRCPTALGHFYFIGFARLVKPFSKPMEEIKNKCLPRDYQWSLVLAAGMNKDKNSGLCIKGDNPALNLREYRRTPVLNVRCLGCSCFLMAEDYSCWLLLNSLNPE